MTDDAAALVVELCVRRRVECVSWAVPVGICDAQFEAIEAGSVVVKVRAVGSFDLDSGGAGGRLDEAVWDFRVRSA